MPFSLSYCLLHTSINEEKVRKNNEAYQQPTALSPLSRSLPARDYIARFLQCGGGCDIREGVTLDYLAPSALEDDETGNSRYLEEALETTFLVAIVEGNDATGQRSPKL